MTLRSAKSFQHTVGDAKPSLQLKKVEYDKTDSDQTTASGIESIPLDAESAANQTSDDALLERIGEINSNKVQNAAADNNQLENEIGSPKIDQSVNTSLLCIKEVFVQTDAFQLMPRSKDASVSPILIVVEDKMCQNGQAVNDLDVQTEIVPDPKKIDAFCNTEVFGKKAANSEVQTDFGAVNTEVQTDPDVANTNVRGASGNLADLTSQQMEKDHKIRFIRMQDVSLKAMQDILRSSSSFRNLPKYDAIADLKNK